MNRLLLDVETPGRWVEPFSLEGFPSLLRNRVADNVELRRKRQARRREIFTYVYGGKRWIPSSSKKKTYLFTDTPRRPPFQAAVQKATAWEFAGVALKMQYGRVGRSLDHFSWVSITVCLRGGFLGTPRGGSRRYIPGPNVGASRFEGV